jgi:hypothetical protein
MRLSLVTLDDMMSHAAHDRGAFHYGCWGAGVTVATAEEKKKDPLGFSLTQDDGLAHDLAIAYYTNYAVIPDVVPDGKYVLGWSWYGGVVGTPLANVDTAPGTVRLAAKRAAAAAPT